MIQFKALGCIALRGPQGPADGLAAQPRRLALLSWLALALPRGPHRRDQVLALFWPESDEARARNSLSQSIYHLRRELEPELLVGRGAEMLGLDFSRLECDVFAFEAAAGAGSWPELRDRYGGELLPGFHVSGVPEYERWLERERNRLATLATDAAWRVANSAAGSGDTATAVEAARWAAGQVPYDEAALRRLLAVLGRVGDRAGVLDAYEAFAQRLSREFGERPAPETEALVAGVRSRRLESAMPATSLAPGTDLPVPAAVPVPARTRRLRTLLLATAGVLLLAAGASIAWLRTARASATPAGRAVAIMPFATHGTPSLGYLADGVEALLEAKLDGAGGARLVDPVTVHAMLPVEAGRAADDVQAIEAARRLRASHFVTGDLTVVGEQVQLRAVLRDGNGTVVRTATTSGRRDALFALADTIAVRLLADLAGLRMRERQGVGAAPTGSIDALRAYVDGESAMAAGRYAEAAELFGQAIARDSGFALAAYRGASAMDWASRGNDTILAMLALAGRRQDRLSGRQRLLLAAATAFYRQDGDSAERVLRGIVADDPDAIEAWFLLGETLFHLNAARGRSWREARAPFERVLSFDGDDPESLLHLARVAAADGDAIAMDSLARAAQPSLRGSVRGWELEGLRAWTSRDAGRIASFRRSLADAPPGAAEEVARALAVYLEDIETAAEVERLDPSAGAANGARDRYAAPRGRWREALAEASQLPCAGADAVACAATRLAMLDLPGVVVPVDRRAALQAQIEPAAAATARAPASYQALLAQLMLGRDAASRGDRERWAVARARLTLQAGETPTLAGYPAWLDALWFARQGGPPALTDSVRLLLRQPEYRRRLLGPDVAWPARLDIGIAIAQAGGDDEALPLLRSIPDPSGRDLMFLPYARLEEARILARRGQDVEARRLYGHVLQLWRDAEGEFRPFVAAVRAESTQVGQ